MEMVKIFTQGTSDEFAELEQTVNAWLSENVEVEIIARHVAGAAGASAEKFFINCTIVIFYRKKSRGA
ncbi:hypothetical protein A3E39_04720 [Candidatus Uhrbacteria bacterium RIFCSPHIGHO2_12_FULL_60_25]|uniref:Uncharacterized protein n=1 Tax=Candidatus Uhrbacteria bacterium RIFCSPHIGHO2_12_FULL_60_25 TaxID=1802399 RepID=A0A1F7UKW1_9BACT|nr:MAG: hypothetical protein A3D73_04065 [Candidatus Uhrbacteria bacterium RIFCSPHIGHO2_02_FULL_60_44]OGL78338.1 MAG: hypothetical protein A3E39_04720 [Candidatus Uhrbacteria bacterium RIFCSPHIGHO2_12_FULL_60_25]